MMCLFTSRSLTLQLNSDVSLLDLLKCWLRESYWGYAARLTNAIDRERYHECVANTLKKYFNDSSLVRLVGQMMIDLNYTPLVIQVTC